MSEDPPPPNTTTGPEIGANDAFPTQSASSHGQLALSNLRNAITSGNMAAVSQALMAISDSDFKGLTGTALVQAFTEGSAQLMSHNTAYMNKGAGLSLMGLNILNTKLGIIGVSEAVEAKWVALQAQAIAEQWTQAEFDAARQELINEGKSEIQTLRNNFDSAHDSLKNDVANGNVPTVPANMNPSVPDAPQMDGVGGNFGDIVSALGPAFTPLQSILQAANPQSLMQPAQQLINPLTKSLQGFKGEGQGVPLSRDSLNKLIKAQGGKELGNQGPSLGRPKGLPGDRENKEGSGLANLTNRNSDDGPRERVVRPEGTLDPISDADASAMVNPPSTEASAPTTVATTLSSAGEVPDTSPSAKSVGTELSSAGGGSAAGPSLSAAGGAPMMGGMPMGGMPMTPGMAGGKPPVSIVGSRSETQVSVSANTKLDDKPMPKGYADPKWLPKSSRVETSDTEEGSSRRSALSVHSSRAARALSSLYRSHKNTGVVTNIAVAQFSPMAGHPDGRVVAVTSDGLGFLPYGVKAPPRVEMLGSLELPDSFRRDWMGCDNPSLVLSEAVKDGILPEPDLFLTNSEGVDSAQVLTNTTLDSLPGDTLIKSRDAFPKLPDSTDPQEVIYALAPAWGANPEVTLPASEARAWTARWSGHRDFDYIAHFAQNLVSDAVYCLSKDDENGARYSLWHLIQLPAG